MAPLGSICHQQAGSNEQAVCLTLSPSIKCQAADLLVEMAMSSTSSRCSDKCMIVILGLPLAASCPVIISSWSPRSSSVKTVCRDLRPCTPSMCNGNPCACNFFLRSSRGVIESWCKLFLMENPVSNPVQGKLYSYRSLVPASFSIAVQGGG